MAVRRKQVKKVKKQMSEYQIVKHAAPFLGDISDKYLLLKDAYSGTGGFEDGTYLVPHPREPLDKYVRRCFMAYYCNYTKPCIDAHVNPIFKEYPVRKYNANPFFDEFLKNVDGKGTKIDRYMKRTAIKAKLFGCVFGIVDNYIEQASDFEEAIRNRTFPYMYIVRPNQIEDWATDQFGNIMMFKYKLRYTELVNENKISKSVIWTWTNDKWIKVDEHGRQEGDNPIGIIPVVPLFGALNDEDDDITPQSEFYPIAKTNLAIFNACSELRERNRNQAFSLLTYPIGEGDDYETANEIAIGTTDMLVYKAGSSRGPEYISPDSAPSQMLLDEIKNMVQEIYRMAERANVTGVQEQTSGIAKEWDNQSTNQTIAEFAKSLEEFEEKIAILFGRYINKDLDYASTYNSEFGVVDTSAELDKVTKALMLNIGGKFNKEVKKQAARVVLNELDDDELNAILDEIDQQSDDIDYSKSEDD
ncbi:hypothetical protein [Anaerosinus massiliensis]|uniref:hypothetical protein n=1 Tax=Massilibacillus massiliensis TaxID=1806837 RepID=UPI000DA5F42C|nr:hypothetical protein [Massilibacillus massiliensis]